MANSNSRTPKSAAPEKETKGTKQTVGAKNATTLGSSSRSKGSSSEMEPGKDMGNSSSRKPSSSAAKTTSTGRGSGK